MNIDPPIEAADERRARLDHITEKIIGCVHQVSNVLGPGFLEKVYENALGVELRLAGLRVTQQQRIEVRYRESLVGDFVADLLVEECVIVEIKAVKAFEDIHTAQCVNYLKATGLQVCLLVNFGLPKAIVKRIVHGF
jgi:GxxExxY protein